MNVDHFIEGLSLEATDAVRRLLRQAYDRGFREALESTGQTPVPVPVPATAVAPTSAPVVAPALVSPGPVPPAPVLPTDSQAASVEWTGDPGEDSDDVSEDDDDTAGNDAPVIRPINPLATVGTLRRRIIRTFDLERFDIEVVLCRAGDTDRRQLKARARLGLYRRDDR